MDTAVGRYLCRVDGLDAQIWVAPSRGQLFWLRRAPSLFAPAVHSGGKLARWWAIATVTPSTNVTGLNLPYQAYLNMVLHRTRLARVGHGVCMPLIVAALLAAYCPARSGSARDLSTGPCRPPSRSPLVAGLGGQGARPVLGVALVAVPCVAANAAYALRAGTQPVAWALVSSLLQAASHTREPLPPPVTRSTRRLGVGEYLWGAPGARDRPATALRRTSSSPRRSPSVPSTNSSPRCGCSPCRFWTCCGAPGTRGTAGRP